MGTLKLIRRPIRLFAAFKHVRSWAQWIGNKTSTDLISTITASSSRQIQSVAAIQFEALILDRQRNLTGKSNGCPTQFITETFFVGRFQESGAQVAVSVDGRRDNSVRQAVNLSPLCDLGSRLGHNLKTLCVSSASPRLCGEQTLARYSRGALIHSRTLFRMSSCFRRSDSAWKFRRMRWRNTGI